MPLQNTQIFLLFYFHLHIPQNNSFSCSTCRKKSKMNSNLFKKHDNEVISKMNQDQVA